MSIASSKYFECSCYPPKHMEYFCYVYKCMSFCRYLCTNTHHVWSCFYIIKG